MFDADGNDIGDVEFSVDYQIKDGLDGWPSITGSLRAKTDTGTDPYSVETFDVVPTDENGDCFANDDGECLTQRLPKEFATRT